MTQIGGYLTILEAARNASAAFQAIDAARPIYDVFKGLDGKRPATYVRVDITNARIEFVIPASGGAVWVAMSREQARTIGAALIEASGRGIP